MNVNDVPAQMTNTVRELLAAISNADGERFRSTVTSDLVTEMPFARPPFPKMSSGGEAIAEKITGSSSLFTAFSLRATRYYPSPETNTLVAEAESDGTLVSGGTYSNQYVFLFFFREGKICRWREYFDPTRLPQLT